MSVIFYCARRLFMTVPVLLGVFTIAFVVTKTVPGDPLAGFLPEDPTAEQYELLSREFGLDKPLHVQWYRYLTRVLRGDLGRSLRTGSPVAADLKPALVATLELTFFAFVLTILIGIPLGIFLGARQGSLIDHVLSVASLGGVAAPLFWTALMAQVFFYGTLGWLPLGGRLDEYLALATPLKPYTGLLTLDALVGRSFDVLKSALLHLILPASVLAYRASALVIRLTRSVMLDVLRSQYIRTARAIGLSEWKVVVRWGFRNALLPVLTVLGLTFGQLLQGSILVEAVFNWPGLGLYTVQSILRLDYPGVIAATVLITFAYVVINLFVDLMYPLVDPTVRLAGNRK